MDVGLFYILLEEQRKTEVKFGIVNVIVVMKKILMVGRHLWEQQNKGIWKLLSGW